MCFLVVRVRWACVCAGPQEQERVCGSRSGEGATLRSAVRLLSKMGLHMYTRLTDSVNARVMVPSVSVGAWLKGRIQSEMRKCTTARPESSKREAPSPLGDRVSEWPRRARLEGS